MVGIGFGLTWFGYSVCLYGYCLVKQYQVGFLDLVRPSAQPPWPPPLNPDAASSQQAQPVVQEQYLAPLTGMATGLAAIASALGGAMSLLQGIPGIPDTGAGAANAITQGLLGGGGSSPSTSTPSTGAGTASKVTTPTPAATSTNRIAAPTAGGTSGGTKSGWTVTTPKVTTGTAGTSGWTVTNLS